MSSKSAKQIPTCCKGSFFTAFYPSHKKCYLCTATLHWPLIKWCMMESKLLLKCKYSLKRQISNQSKKFKTYMTRELILMWERLSTNALIMFSNFRPKTLKASNLQNYIIFAIISLSKMLRPTDLNSWVGNWEHLTSMEKVFTNSMKDNMSHQLPSTAQSIRGNLISSEIIWGRWKHQCFSNVNIFWWHNLHSF